MWAAVDNGRTAGVVSSVMGFLQTGGAALSGYLVGLFYDRTPLSLAATVAFFIFVAVGLTAWSLVRLWRSTRSSKPRRAEA